MPSLTDDDVAALQIKDLTGTSWDACIMLPIDAVSV